jgi:predicted ArsR family transcriptional regulator
MKESGSDLPAVSSLSDPVRARLYQVVSDSARPVDRDQAASAAGIGRPLAAYHLDKLVDLGLLTASYQRPDGRIGPGAGRPAKVYARSGREFAVTVPPREYELAARLLAAAVDADRDGTSRSLLLKAAREFGADLGARSRSRGPGQPGARPAMEAVLREHGFEPRAAEDGSVQLRNCPFHQLAAAHQDLVCGMNLALLEGLIAGMGEGGMRPCLEPEPGRCCVVLSPDRATGDAPLVGAA